MTEEEEAVAQAILQLQHSPILPPISEHFPLPSSAPKYTLSESVGKVPPSFATPSPTHSWFLQSPQLPRSQQSLFGQPWIARTPGSEIQSRSDAPKVPPTKVCSACRNQRKKCNGISPQCSRCLERGFFCDYSNGGVLTAHLRCDDSLSPTSVESKQTYFGYMKSPPPLMPSTPVMSLKRMVNNLDENEQPHHSKPKRIISCKYCYVKKIKCDKEKPSCGGCLKRGLCCEYVINNTEHNIRVLQTSEMGVTASIYSEESIGSGTKRAKISPNYSSPLAESATSATSLPPSLLCSPLSGTSNEQSLSGGGSHPHEPVTQNAHHSPASLPLNHDDTDEDEEVHEDESLADLVISRLSKLESGTKKRLRCGKLWIRGPSRAKIYCCPCCKKQYKTANGLKYHLNQHSAKDNFPTGYYWVKSGDVDSFDTTERPYICNRDGCDKSFSSPGGLKYHLARCGRSSSVSGSGLGSSDADSDEDFSGVE